MKVLITGGAGFIGSHLAERYINQGDEVMILDDMSTGKRIVEGVEFAQVNILDENSLNKTMHNCMPDIVYHLAATLGVKRVCEEPLKTWKTNVVGTMNVVEAACDQGVKKILNVSTSSIYGDNADNPKRESSPPNSGEVYGISKISAEAYCRSVFEERGLPIVTVRPFNVYGPFQDSTPYGFVICIFIRSLLEGKPLTIFGDGTQMRDFLFVDDCVSGMIRAMEGGKAGESYNLSSYEPIKIIDLAKKLQEMIPSESLKIIFAEKRQGDIFRRWGSNEKMKKLGWFPKINLESGLVRTIEYFENKGAKQ